MNGENCYKVLGLIWLTFELVRDVIDVLVTCQYEEDPIKNRGAREFTRLYINFSDAQGQITLELVVVSGRNLNSSELSYMSSLPARMRMIDLKCIYGSNCDGRDSLTCTLIESKQCLKTSLSFVLVFKIILNLVYLPLIADK